MSHTPLCLIILDGWGQREAHEDNAIAQAATPHWDQWLANYPHTLLSASADAVGLPAGQMGNSEVGHLNMGAGRIIQQDFTRIDAAIQRGDFFHNPVLVNACEQVKAKGSALHVLGLLSPGGVHSHEQQIQALLRLAAQQGLTQVYLHAFLDGRDTPPKSALSSIERTEALFAELGVGRIASLVGRYYAMDRDQRWERVQQAYELLTQGHAVHHASTAAEGLAQAYAQGETDEFVKATSIHAPQQAPVVIQDDDVVVFMNYRADRARQLTRAFTDKTFTGFVREVAPKLADFITLTEYAHDMPVRVAYPPLSFPNVLGEVLAQHGLTQLRIAETEKYAHVTFFFNGGVETPFAGETRRLIPSPKVATYDLQPEMSAPELTQAFVEAVNSQEYDVIIGNYANADMVGHTGNFAATVKAIETLDHCLAQVVEAARAQGGEVLITADHGNAEKMRDKQTGQAHTAHTTELVPLLYIGRQVEIVKAKGRLSDIAPTMLYLLGLSQPQEMTGESLLRLL
jgi:2,3-bisphosphoglycerate-independent phosphoglycerate mutase